MPTIHVNGSFFFMIKIDANNNNCKENYAANARGKSPKEQINKKIGRLSFPFDQ